MTFSLAVETRTVQGKDLVALRAAGKLPAVLNNPKEENTLLTIDRVAFEKLFKQTGLSSIIMLEGLGSPKEVLVNDVAFDARRGGVIHVDFYAVEAGKELTVTVPLEFIGEAPAVKQGGTLTKVLQEVEVTCMPQNIPQHIDVDVSTLIDFEKQILVSDLSIPTGVTIENDPEEVIALVQSVEEDSSETATAIDINAIVVEKKGKVEAE
jgi:large subunit ribosomal protein L25